MDYREIYRRELKGLKNVNGVSLRPKLKVVGGRLLRELSLRVYVDRKVRDPDTIRRLEKSGNLIPPVIDGIKTDVYEVGPMRMFGFDDPKNYYRPAPMGVSGMSQGGTACTIGLLARDLEDSEICYVVNNHCGAGENTHQPGHEYLQTSPYDSAYGKAEKLGHLKRYVPLKYEEYRCVWRDTVTRIFNPLHYLNMRPSSTGYENTVDCALIGGIPCEQIKHEVLNIGPVRGKRNAVEDEMVQKNGRTTNYTCNGRIIDLDYYGKIQYGRGVCVFRDCGLVEGAGFSAGGDSSSPILGMDNSALGMLHGGSDTHTIFAKISNIQEALNVQIIW